MPLRKDAAPCTICQAVGGGRSCHDDPLGAHFEFLFLPSTSSLVTSLCFKLTYCDFPFVLLGSIWPSLPAGGLRDRRYVERTSMSASVSSRRRNEMSLRNMNRISTWRKMWLLVIGFSCGWMCHVDLSLKDQKSLSDREPFLLIALRVLLSNSKSAGQGWFILSKDFKGKCACHVRMMKCIKMHHSFSSTHRSSPGAGCIEKWLGVSTNCPVCNKILEWSKCVVFVCVAIMIQLSNRFHESNVAPTCTSQRLQNDAYRMCIDFKVQWRPAVPKETMFFWMAWWPQWPCLHWAGTLASWREISRRFRKSSAGRIRDAHWRWQLHSSPGEKEAVDHCNGFALEALTHCKTIWTCSELQTKVTQDKSWSCPLLDIIC